jgi:hypothetical protein
MITEAKLIQRRLSLLELADFLKTYSKPAVSTPVPASTSMISRTHTRVKVRGVERKDTEEALH